MEKKNLIIYLQKLLKLSSWWCLGYMGCWECDGSLTLSQDWIWYLNLQLNGRNCYCLALTKSFKSVLTYIKTSWLFLDGMIREWFQIHNNNTPSFFGFEEFVDEFEILTFIFSYFFSYLDGFQIIFILRVIWYHPHITPPN